MNVHAAIVDQRLTGILETHPEWFPWDEEPKCRSAAFVLLCMSTSLDLPLEECADLLTEGGNDAGVDGLYLGDLSDGDFVVTLFQGKYRKDLSGTANFPENGVKAAIQTAQMLFDPERPVPLNDRIAPHIEEVRSRIKDGDMPTARFVLCNNGTKWTDQADLLAQDAEEAYRGQLQLVHYNHEDIVKTLSRGSSLDATLALNGPMVTEDLNFRRVLVGRISVQELRRLFEEHGDGLLERNIRRYLGASNRVNAEIRRTLLDPDAASNFYFYNNGITAVCDSLAVNEFQQVNHVVRAKGIQIINGGQTCKTIYQALQNKPDGGHDAFVLIRLYQLPEASNDIVHEITRATNSQSPVNLRDLHSNDNLQKALAIGMSDLGYTYRHHDQDGRPDDRTFTSTAVAEAVLAVWRSRPHQSRFRRKEHFGRLYEHIFEGLNAAQAIIAALIYRDVNRRRREASLMPLDEDSPRFLPYASFHLAMVVGRQLVSDAGVAAVDVSHHNFHGLRDALTESGDRYYANALETIDAAIRDCYGDRVISLQQLSATFRRGDLLEMLNA